ncbi:MAG: hypothetical protein MK086_02215 [Flavobacteriales bacterium]|nr:hypothetical protein [Flavobacteriales bacterium]
MWFSQEFTWHLCPVDAKTLTAHKWGRKRTAKVEAEVIRRRYSDWGCENDEEKQELVEEIMTGFPRFSE